MAIVGNKEVVNILKELKVLDKYKNNILKVSTSNKRDKLKYLLGARETFTIIGSFSWDATPEKKGFWNDINSKFLVKYQQSKKIIKSNKKL